MNKEQRERGLYSNNRLLLHTEESLLANDRIFVGNQTDDFGIASLLQNSNRILLLGLGYGGALRSMLIGNGDVQITAVDMNPRTIKACSSIMEDFFPEISNKINYVQNDAFQFLSTYTGSFYDVICIDIYTNSGYPPIVFEEKFWISIKNVLSQNGTVLFNSWGLPQQLSPLEGNTVQRNIAQLMCDHFPYLNAVPSRRNITFIAHHQQNLEIKKNIYKSDLNDIDRLIVEFFPQRVKYAAKISSEKIKDDNVGSKTIEEFNDEMYKRWPGLVNKCNQALQHLGLHPINKLSELVYDPIRAKSMTKQLLDWKAIESDTIPILLGAYAFEKPEGLEWYLQWMLEDGEELMNSHKEWFINTAFWQLLAIAANPYANYANWARDIEQLMDKLELR